MDSACWDYRLSDFGDSPAHSKVEVWALRWQRDPGHLLRTLRPWGTTHQQVGWGPAHPGKAKLQVSMEPITMVTKPQRQDSSRARKDKLLSCPYPRSLTGGGGGKQGQSGFLSRSGGGGKEQGRLSSYSMGQP